MCVHQTTDTLTNDHLFAVGVLNGRIVFVHKVILDQLNGERRFANAARTDNDQLVLGHGCAIVCLCSFCVCCVVCRRHSRLSMMCRPWGGAEVDGSQSIMRLLLYTLLACGVQNVIRRSFVWCVPVSSDGGGNCVHDLCCKMVQL